MTKETSVLNTTPITNQFWKVSTMFVVSGTFSSFTFWLDEVYRTLDLVNWNLRTHLRKMLNLLS